MKAPHIASLRCNKGRFLALVVLLFSVPASGAGKEGAPEVKIPAPKASAVERAIEPPPPVRPHPPASVIFAPPPVSPVGRVAGPPLPSPPPRHHAAPFSYSPSQPMVLFGFLGLLLFCASAGVFGRRRPFEVGYRKFPYGPHRSRQNRFN